MRAASGPRSTISLLRTDKLALISVPEILKINERYLVNGEKTRVKYLRVKGPRELKVRVMYEKFC